MSVRASPALALLAALALPSPAAAVVGGTVSRDPDGPRRSVARVESSAGHLCSGVIVAPDLVLTAAHCIAARASYRVVAVDRSFRSRPVAVAGVLVHPTFVPGTTPRTQPGTDLALLKLEQRLGSDFLPLDPSRPAQVSPGEAVTLAGFGLGDERNRRTARTLRLTSLVSSGSLQVANRVLVVVDPQHRAARTGAGACRGDSGGPVLAAASGGYALIGVVSWANGAAGERRNCGGFTAITPLAEHVDWIQESAARLGQGARSGEGGRRVAR